LVGSFHLAHAAATEGYRLSLDVGRGSAWHLTNLAVTEASLGRFDDARRHAEERVSVGRRMGSTFITGRAEWALALVAQEDGRPQEALDRLLILTSLETQGANPLIAMRPSRHDRGRGSLRAHRSPR
jgi:hypothetical protein